MGNIIVSGAAGAKAGVNISTAILNSDWVTWISGAEAIVNTTCRENWSDSYLTLNDDLKCIIADTVASIVAVDAIVFDIDAIGRSTAESRITILKDRIDSNMMILKEMKAKDFINEA